MVSLPTVIPSPSSLPLRHTLITQTAQILQEGISRGNWQGKLPAERTLCTRYQVSRNTLRAALQRLQSDRVVQCIHGSGNYILSAAPRKTAPSKMHPVALLAPESLESMRPAQTLWIDELRARLGERGLHLRGFHGRQWFRQEPGRSLERLVAQNPHRCWILALSNAATQRWFSEQGVRCVVAGSVHDGLDLPSCDIDHRAMCRHAAGVLLAQGHRKIALFIDKAQLAGDLESEAGFREGVQPHLARGAEAIFCRHDAGADSAFHALRQMMTRPAAPTAILVANAYHYLTVTTGLLHLGRRVPEDVSVISRDDDRFLSYVVPEPARYTIDPHAMASSLFRMVLEQTQEGAPPRHEVRLMPELIRGKSIAPPRALRVAV